MNKLPRIAITGGIGSGKSYICKLLADHGIEVYDCDAAAKHLMATNTALQEKLSEVVGKEVFKNGILQKPILAKFLLASDKNKQTINEVVHPAVAADFMASDYQWLESAILFDAKFDKRINFDFIVCVIAPEDVRIERITKRDNISREQAQQWINRQMPQEDMARMADFTIVNDGFTDLTATIELLKATIAINTSKKYPIKKEQG